MTNVNIDIEKLPDSVKSEIRHLCYRGIYSLRLFVFRCLMRTDEVAYNYAEELFEKFASDGDKRARRESDSSYRTKEIL